MPAKVPHFRSVNGPKGVLVATVLWTSAQVQLSRTANQQVSTARYQRTRDREPTQVT